MEAITRIGTIRAAEGLPEMTHEFVISTESQDRHGTIFKANGWEFDTYRANPIVAYNHLTGSTDPDNIIGTSEVRQEGTETIARVTLEAGNPKAEAIDRKLKNGTLRSASVGAYPLDYRMGLPSEGEDKNIFYFTRAELLEWSIVDVGSNRDALKRSADYVAELKKEVTTEEVKEMGAETKRNIKVIEQLKRLNKW